MVVRITGINDPLIHACMVHGIACSWYLNIIICSYEVLGSICIVSFPGLSPAFLYYRSGASAPSIYIDSDKRVVPTPRSWHGQTNSLVTPDVMQYILIPLY